MTVINEDEHSGASALFLCFSQFFSPPPPNMYWFPCIFIICAEPVGLQCFQRWWVCSAEQNQQYRTHTESPIPLLSSHDIKHSLPTLVCVDICVQVGLVGHWFRILFCGQALFIHFFFCFFSVSNRTYHGYLHTIVFWYGVYRGVLLHLSAYISTSVCEWMWLHVFIFTPLSKLSYGSLTRQHPPETPHVINSLLILWLIAIFHNYLQFFYPTSTLIPCISLPTDIASSYDFIVYTLSIGSLSLELSTGEAQDKDKRQVS